MKFARIAAAVAALSGVFFGASPAFAAASASPVAECKPGVFLTVGGNVKSTTNSADKTYDFTEAELLAMPTSTIVTSTAWTAKSAFVGPLLSDVLKKVGAGGGTLQLVAFDDYYADMPMDIVAKYGAIVAHTRDGKRLSRRDNGPLFVMLPRDKYPTELNTPLAARWYVWQLCRIEVE